MNSQKLLKLWSNVGSKPFGKKIFSYILGRLVPYTGTVSPEVQLLEPGHAVVKIFEHKRIQNHLSSVHAVALMNVGELATGLACLSALPPTGRTILKNLNISYLKKARGILVAEARTPLLTGFIEKTDVIVNAQIKDEKGDIVATVEATWQAGTPKS